MSMKGQLTSLAERVEIGERWQAGESDGQIAIALDRPIATIRKWRRRVQNKGRAGLSGQMGRPATGSLSRYSEEISKEVLHMREAHPGWGPLTLLVELKKDARLVRKPLPSRSRIAAYLKQKDRVRKYERHRKLPEPKPQVIERPHQEWEVDAQGKITIDGVGSASIINIGDVFSHLKIEGFCNKLTLKNVPVDTINGNFLGK